MVDIKDLAGLSKPLTRLVEVISQGIGGVARPTLVRKNADAKAYEIKTITDAVADSQKQLGPIKYDDGNIVIKSTPDGLLQIPDADIDKRVISRRTYLEAKRQLNLEKITQFAAEDFDGTEKIGDERPDSDWTARFFRIAEDITTEQMQSLWGKVLAGEVKHPGSFSLRTLDILKNISTKEAETFVRAARIAFQCEGKAFIPNADNGVFLESQFELQFSHFLLLREIGLIAPIDLEYSISAVEKDNRTVLICGSTCVLVDRTAGTPKQKFTAVVFTEIGKELLQLIEPKSAHPDHISKFASLIQREGVIVKSGDIIGREGDQLHCENVREVSGIKPRKNG